MTAPATDLATNWCEQTVDAIVAALLALPSEITGVENNVPIVSNLYFSWDTELGAVNLTVRPSRSGGLVAIEAQVSGTPRWFSLNLELGPGAFEPGQTLGLVLSALSREPQDMRGFMRSMPATESGSDTVFADAVHFGPDQVVAVVLHTVERAQAMAMTQGFHTLVLTLPPRSWELELVGVRVFVSEPFPYIR